MDRQIFHSSPDQAVPEDRALEDAPSEDSYPAKKSLRIGVDARPLSFPHSGIGQYLHALLKILLPATTGRVRWYLYSDRCLPEDFPLHDSVLRCGSNSSRLLSTGFAQCYFGRWAKADQLDVFWSPRHQLPVSLSRKIRSVVTLHDLVFETHPQTMTGSGRTLERLLTPRSLKAADAIITTSKSVLSELTAYNAELPPKTRVIPLSSNIADFSTTERAITLPARPYILFCGSTEPRKNLNRLLRSFVRLHAEPSPPPQRLVIVSGGGWKDATTKAIMDEHHAMVEIHRNVTEAQKAALLRNADFLVLPSLTEGFGIPLVEAQKLAIPILTSNTGAMPEVAREAARYVDPYDENSITNALREMCMNAGLRERLSANARLQADDFNWQRSAMATLEVLQSAATH